MKKREIKARLSALLGVVEHAIEAGDWKVDGACDPDLAIFAARRALDCPHQGFAGVMYGDEPWSA